MRRSGMATIEVALCLFVLAVPLSAMFMILSYTYSASGLAVAARCRAWAGRHQPWESHTGSSLKAMDAVADQSFATILGPSPRMNPNEVLMATTRKEAMLFGVDSEIGSDHFVLGGTWDHTEIPFERHGRLAPSAKFTLFTNQSANWSRFSSLADFASAAAVANVASKSDKLKELKKLDGRDEAALRPLVAKQISSKEVERVSLQRRIKRLEDDEDAAPGLLSELRRKLREVEAELADLRNALANLEAASNIHPN